MRTRREALMDVRENQVELLLRLEAELEWHDERVVHACQNQSFGKGMCNFSTLNNMLLADSLQGIDT